MVSQTNCEIAMVLSAGSDLKVVAYSSKVLDWNKDGFLKTIIGIPFSSQSVISSFISSYIRGSYLFTASNNIRLACL